MKRLKDEALQSYSNQHNDIFELGIERDETSRIDLVNEDGFRFFVYPGGELTPARWEHIDGVFTLMNDREMDK